MDLPALITDALAPLLARLPPERALASLVVEQPADADLSRLVQRIIQAPALADQPALVSALWLYVDELDLSHRVSQTLPDVTGSFWHGIMHRREGDFSNSHHWFHKAGHHPAMKLIPGYDAHAFIDRVEAAHRQGQAPAELVELQRREWRALFQWCASSKSC